MEDSVTIAFALSLIGGNHAAHDCGRDIPLRRRCGADLCGRFLRRPRGADLRNEVGRGHAPTRERFIAHQPPSAKTKSAALPRVRATPPRCGRFQGLGWNDCGSEVSRDEVSGTTVATHVASTGRSSCRVDSIRPHAPPPSVPTGLKPPSPQPGSSRSASLFRNATEVIRSAHRTRHAAAFSSCARQAHRTAARDRPVRERSSPWAAAIPPASPTD